MSGFNVWPKVKVAPNGPSNEEFAGIFAHFFLTKNTKISNAALELFESDGGATWESIRNLLVDNQLADFDPVREAFMVYSYFTRYYSMAILIFFFSLLMKTVME